MRTLAVIAVIAVLATVSLAACGSGRKQDPRAVVRDVYAAYGKAILAADGTRGCDLLSAAAQRRFLAQARQLGATETTCPAAFQRIAPQLPRISYALTDVVVLLGRASAVNPQLTGSSAKPVEFVLVSGHWKVDTPQ